MVLLYQNRRASNIQYPHSLIHETSQQGSSANHHLLFAIRRIISQKVGDHCILQDRGLVTGYCGNPILTIRCRKCSNFGTASVTATTEISGPSTHASFPQSLLIVFFHLLLSQSKSYIFPFRLLSVTMSRLPEDEIDAPPSYQAHPPYQRSPTYQLIADNSGTPYHPS
jgi:hypothetical protein